MFALPVFEFRGKRKTLTFYGQALYEETKSALSKIQQGLESVDRMYLDPRKQILRVDCRHELVLRAQKAIKFKGVVHFLAMSSEEALQQLTSKKIDVATCRFKPQSADLIAKEFFSNSSVN